MPGPHAYGSGRLAERLNRLHGGSGEAPEVLGTIAPEHLDPEPKGASATWETASGGGMSLDEGPPPWELEDAGYSDSDARRYVDVPVEWTLRWINPKLLESSGWRYWRAVAPSDTRVTVKVEQMLSPDGTVRRGGSAGDILAYMPTHWVESRRRMMQQETARLTASAVDRQQTLREEFRRGTFGPHISLEDRMTHPTHTIAEGSSLRD